MVILGIDPGLLATGFGIVEAEPAQLRFIAAGDIRPPKTHALAERLEHIHVALSRLIGRYRPEIAVLEKIFTHHRHVTTAAFMGHARGVACLAVQEYGLAMEQYPTTQVKKTLTGNGQASKEQVARMAAHWLRHADPSWSMDATDALALAIVHAHIALQRRNLPAGVAA